MTVPDTEKVSTSTSSSHTSLPPPFQGRPDESIVEFLTRYGLCVRANGWDESKACWKLSTCLTGRALQAYLSFDENYRSSYNTVRLALLCHLIKPPYQAAAEFRDRHLGAGESVDTLIYDLNKLYFEAHFTEPNVDVEKEEEYPKFDEFVKLNTDANYQRDMILKIMDALPEHIASHLRVMRFTTVDEIARQARIELATHPYDSPPSENALGTAAPLADEDPFEEIAALREEVAALRRYGGGKGQGRHRYGQAPTTGYDKFKYRRPGQKKWCTYHRVNTHWTSECHAIKKLADEREPIQAANAKDLPPNGGAATDSIAPSL
ncbi:hypothetical protein FOZ63_030141 [Perkinsus olseni]|uniref:Uncharacterized protein n=1 Tax=Perkinsus olseni TaxID=32597 RepID=A0A7J6Q7N1_PEROL|nr:hypothetical protein FOZ63_030141 [Perkinsus olseni]